MVCRRFFDNRYPVGFVLDSNNTPHISYTNFYTIVYSFRQEEKWITETIESEFWSSYASLRLDSNDKPHLQFSQKYAYKTDSGWIVEVLGDGNGISLAQFMLDTHNNPHLIYQQSGYWKYSTKTAGNWITEILDLDYRSFALDNNDVPHLVYGEEDKLMYAYRPHKNWIVEEVADGDSRGGISFALDHNNQPHIFYLDAGGVVYLHKADNSWQLPEIVEYGNIGPIALDRNGTPYICYSTDYQEATLKLAHRNMTQWHQVISPSTPGSFLPPAGDIFFSFPENAFTQTVTLAYSLLNGQENAPALRGLGRIFNLKAYDNETDQPAQLKNGVSFTATVTYSDNDVRVIHEDTLALYWWDGLAWVKESNSIVYPNSNTIIATPDHLGIWAIMGEPVYHYLPLIIRE